MSGLWDQAPLPHDSSWHSYKQSKACIHASWRASDICGNMYSNGGSYHTSVAPSCRRAVLSQKMFCQSQHHHGSRMVPWHLMNASYSSLALLEYHLWPYTTCGGLRIEGRNDTARRAAGHEDSTAEPAHPLHKLHQCHPRCRHLSQYCWECCHECHQLLHPTSKPMFYMRSNSEQRELCDWQTPGHMWGIQVRGRILCSSRQSCWIVCASRSLGYLRFVLMDTCLDFYIFEINILKCQTKTAIYMYIYYIYIYINILSYALLSGSDPWSL